MDLFARIDDAEARFEALEPSIHAFLPEDGRFHRLRREARALCDRYPGRAERPPLFGVLAGVKDLFHVDGLPTRAGSRLPPTVLQGTEAESVLRLKAAGALVVGKTVTTEFAHFTPGPTRNPRNPAHTPGGSSSGSAAAVAAGFCDLALGSQTIGSIIRPAAFCGVVGLKPTYGRISAGGVIPLAPSLDHVGCLASDVEMAMRAARVLYTTWTDAPPSPRPVFGIPEGPYLERLPADTAEWFGGVCSVLSGAGYVLRRVPVMADYREVCERQQIILAAEAARVHQSWFDEHEALYGSKVAELIRRGRSVTGEQLERALAGQVAFRRALQELMTEVAIDAWICPSTTGPAPEGLESTGDPVMNLPWTQAGLPVVGLPAGTHRTGLPMGLQVVGRWQNDESLLLHCEGVERVVKQL
jgi:Asp-tRNA(Asn)/Glu-tRNA(Gln) amidotransferase A subunit family amidase